jgi:hypothetical protein
MKLVVRDICLWSGAKSPDQERKLVLEHKDGLKLKVDGKVVEFRPMTGTSVPALKPVASEGFETWKKVYETKKGQTIEVEVV